MKKLIIICIAMVTVVTVYSCKKDYVIGGSLYNPKVDMTTYDYLKTKRLFDTLIIMVDRMGLKDEVNSSGTVFALTNYAISNYVKEKQAHLRIKLNDENLVFTFDSLKLSELKDSLRAYLFKDKLPVEALSEVGKLRKSNDGEFRLIQAIPTTDYTDPNIFPVKPKYVYLTKIVKMEDGSGTIPTDSTQLPLVDPAQLLQARVQTSGIITNTGVIHVVNNNHTFTFFGDIKN
jgi:hypothetical protein